MMRCLRFLLITFLSLAFQLTYAQSVEEPLTSRNDPSKTVHIYPNPAVAVEYVHVKVGELLAEKTKLTLHNILGNKMEVETEVVDEHELRVRIKDLASGYYLISVKDENLRSIGIYKLLKR